MRPIVVHPSIIVDDATIEHQHQRKLMEQKVVDRAEILKLK